MPERLAGQWQHALFLAYTIDLEFFEHQVWWPLPETCRNVVVLADEDCLLDACEREASRRLVNHLNRRYVVDGLRFPGAAHAKIVLLTNEKQGRLLVGSGNLGPRGWVRGGEVFTAYDYEGEDAAELAPFLATRDLLTELLETGRVEGIARDRVELLLTETTWLYEGGIADAAPLRHNLDRPFLEQLIEAVGGRTVDQLRVLSPFYDARASALSELLAALQPAASEIYVEPGCTSVDPVRLAAVRDAQTSPCEVRPFKRDGCDYVHAKVYLAKTREEDVLLTGSPNLSRGAMLNLAKNANFEVASLLTAESGEFDYLFENLLAAPPQDDLSTLELKLAESDDFDGEGERLVLMRAVLRKSELEMSVRGLPAVEGLRLRIGDEVLAPQMEVAPGEPAIIRAALDDELRELLSRCVPLTLLVTLTDGEVESNAVFVMDKAALAAEARSPQARGVTSEFTGIPLDDELAEIVLPLEIAFGDFRGAWRPAAKAANPSLTPEDEDRFIAYDSVDLDAVRQHPKIQQYLHSHGVHSFGGNGHETVLDTVPLSVAEFFRQFARTEAGHQQWEEAAIVVGEDDGAVSEEAAEEIRTRILDLQQRRQWAVRRFVTSCLRGVTSEGFGEIAGFAFLSRVYAIFNHVLLRFSEKRWVDLEFLADVALSLWEFYWGTPAKAGVYFGASEAERALALQLLEEHAEPQTLLAMLSALSQAAQPDRPQPLSEELRRRLRDVLQGILLREPFDFGDAAARSAVNLCAALAVGDPPTADQVADALLSTERSATLLEFVAQLVEVLGPAAKGAGFVEGVQCRRPALKQNWGARCLVFISPEAIDTPDRAILALRCWMRFQPELAYYRMSYPPEDTNVVQVAFYDRIDDSGAYKNSSSGVLEKLGPLAALEPAWQAGLDHLQDVFLLADAVSESGEPDAE